MKVANQNPQVGPGYIIAQVVTIALFYVIAVAASGFRDINDALAFYGVYHREPMNQLIHFVGVPMIIWSFFVFLAHLPVPFLTQYQITLPGTPAHFINYAAIAALGYALFYIKIDTFGGLLYAPVLYIMYATSVRMTVKDQAEANKKTDGNASWIGTGKVLQVAAVAHVLAWYLQIHPGHAVIEGAKPALMDSFGGALTSAPLFAFYEGLWFFGINRPLQERTQTLVAQYTAELCAAGANMRVCANV